MLVERVPPAILNLNFDLRLSGGPKMARHVTTFRLRAQAGKGDAVLAMFDKWDRERRPKVTGFQRSVVVKSNNDAEEFTVIVEFDYS